MVAGGVLGVAGIVLFFTGYSKYSTSKDNLQSGGGMTFWCVLLHSVVMFVIEAIWLGSEKKTPNQYEQL